MEYFNEPEFHDPADWDVASYTHHPVDDLEPIPDDPTPYRAAALQCIQILACVDVFMSRTADPRLVWTAVSCAIGLTSKPRIGPSRDRPTTWRDRAIGAAGYGQIARRAKLETDIAKLRSSVTQLSDVKALRDAICKSKDYATRLRLREEIRRRVTRIDIHFGLDGFKAVADVQFVNGVVCGLAFTGKATLVSRGEGTI